MLLSGISDESGQPIALQIKAHKQLGWKYIELRQIDKVNLTDVPDQTFDAILGAVTDAGLTISCFASQLCNWSRPITGDFALDVNELRRAIPRMRRAGTKFIRIMSYPNDKDKPLPDSAWRDEAVRRIHELAKMAEDGGVMLAHENCNGWGGEGPANSLELLKRVASPAMTLLFDTGNTVCHGQDSWGYYDAIKEKVSYIHIKDAVLKADGSPEFRFPGEGDGQVLKILTDAHRRGYKGFVSIEPHVSAIVHLGAKGQAPSEQALYDSYIKYGTMLAALVAKAQKA